MGMRPQPIDQRGCAAPESDRRQQPTLRRFEAAVHTVLLRVARRKDSAVRGTCCKVSGLRAAYSLPIYKPGLTKRPHRRCATTLAQRRIRYRHTIPDAKPRSSQPLLPPRVYSRAKHRNRAMRDILIRAAAFVVLTTALSVLMAVPYLPG